MLTTTAAAAAIPKVAEVLVLTLVFILVVLF